MLYKTFLVQEQKLMSSIQCISSNNKKNTVDILGNFLNINFHYVGTGRCDAWR